MVDNNLQCTIKFGSIVKRFSISAPVIDMITIAEFHEEALLKSDLSDCYFLTMANGIYLNHKQQLLDALLSTGQLHMRAIYPPCVKLERLSINKLTKDNFIPVSISMGRLANAVRPLGDVRVGKTGVEMYVRTGTMRYIMLLKLVKTGMVIMTINHIIPHELAGVDIDTCLAALNSTREIGKWNFDERKTLEFCAMSAYSDSQLMLNAASLACRQFERQAQSLPRLPLDQPVLQQTMSFSLFANTNKACNVIGDAAKKATSCVEFEKAMENVCFDLLEQCAGLRVQ